MGEKEIINWRGKCILQNILFQKFRKYLTILKLVDFPCDSVLYIHLLRIIE